MNNVLQSFLFTTNESDVDMSVFWGIYITAIVIALIIVIVSFAIMIVAIVKLMNNESYDSNERLVWILLIVLASPIGGIIFLVMNKNKSTQPIRHNQQFYSNAQNYNNNQQSYNNEQNTDQN